MSFRVESLVCLRYVIIVFLVRRHVNHFFRNSGVEAVGLVYLTVRGFHKTVFVDSRIGCKRVNQSDVGSFRRLNGAHSSVVGIMYVTDLKSGTVPGKTAGAKGGKTSLVRQLA